MLPALRLLPVIASVVACLAGPAALADCGAGPGEAGRVGAIVDGDTLTLETGLTVRLAGIEAPKRLVGEAGEGQPSVAAARAALANLARNQAVTLHYDTAHRDRHGRAIAIVRLAGGRVLQEAMLDQGLARVHGPVPADCLAVFLGGEQAARVAGKGIWREPQFAVRSADDPSLRTQNGLYEIVEGRVASVGRGTSVVFLNFGRDRRRDFTVMIATGLARPGGRGEASLESLAGKRIRVRGVIEASGGALIRLGEWGDIEVLGR
ncbi:MAG: thermonuclease family protein [Bauldia sp.]